MEIAVLGGGHGSYAAAADLSLQGHSVRLWRRDAQALTELRARPVITLLSSKESRDAHIAVVTDQIGVALRGADLILVPLPATAQEDLATLIGSGC